MPMLKNIQLKRTNMENQDQPLDSGMQPEQQDSGLQITDTIRQYWRQSSQWGLFFSVLGFIYLGLLVISLLSAQSVAGFGMSLIMLLIVGVIVFIPTWLMFKFSQEVKKGVEHDSTTNVQEGFSQLRRLYQFAGILTIVILSLYVIFFLFGLLMMGRAF